MATQPPTTSAVSLVPFGSFGPRATPLSGEYTTSTLFVGLGQVGWHTVSLISNMLNSSLSQKDLGHVQYLAIAKRPAVTPEGRLGREHLLLLSLEETDWAHIPGRYSGVGVARWWPKPPRDRAAMPDMNNIRAYGRLLLYDNPSLVNEAVIQRTNNLVAAGMRPGADGRRLVVLAASLAEAEGSGMLSDIAWLLRLHLAEAPTMIIALLTADIGPGVDEETRTLGVANVYATLKELDALMVSPAQYPIGLPLTHGTSRFGNNEAHRPLDYLLITGDSMKANESTPPAAALAEMRVTWVLSNVNNSRTDLAPINVTKATGERFEGYTTFNVSKICFPFS